MADETVLRIKERIRQEMRDLLGVTMADRPSGASGPDRRCRP